MDVFYVRRVENDPDLKSLAGWRTPVVCVDGKQVTHFEVNARKWEAAIRERGGVHAIVVKHAPAFVESLLGAAGLGRGEVERWAVHPGGRAVVEAVGESLGLSAGQGRSAFDVLASCGNMSSATIFFVLARELERPGPRGPIAALGFGPGLTMEGAVFSPCR